MTLNYAGNCRKELKGGKKSIDSFAVTNATFNNLNMLQCAVVTGHVRLLEDAVALGAALDYPVLNGATHKLHYSNRIS